MNIISPQQGSIIDMEQMDLQSKLQFLKGQELLKCMNRKEILSEHSSTWQSNGLSSFKLHPEFKIVDKRYHGNDFCVIYTVELALNHNHWSDQRSGETDRQY